MMSSCKGQKAYNPAGWWLCAHLCSACRGVRGKTTRNVPESCFNTPPWDTAGRRSPSRGRQKHEDTHRFVSQLFQLLDVGGDEGVQVLQDLLHLQRRQQEAESLHQPHALACLGGRGDTSRRVTASHRRCPRCPCLHHPPCLGTWLFVRSCPSPCGVKIPPSCLQGQLGLFSQAFSLFLFLPKMCLQLH